MRAAFGGRLYLLILLSAGLVWSADLSLAHRQCPERPRCKGCGCAGGPGYRSIKTGECVGFRQLKSVCGGPPTKNCIFENAPGVGENADCAMHEHPEKKKRQ